MNDGGWYIGRWKGVRCSGGGGKGSGGGCGGGGG